MSASQPSNIRRVVIASFIGTTIEWYDFFLYGTAAALVFNKLFFPSVDPVTGTMAAFMTFAVGFFARPLGGIVFGHFGDKIGRKSMLVTTLMMMGVATVLIGVLPTYDQIGVAAPVLLVALRFIQGFGVGGEWGGAVLMAVEHGHEGKRGFHASWVQAGVPVGLLLANGVFRLASSMDEKAFLAWGWRIPFLLGVLLLLVGMFIRMKIMESPIFTEAKAADPGPKVPILAVIRDHPRNVILSMGARFAENAFFYIFTVLVLSFGSQQLGISKDFLLNAVLLGSAVQLVAIPWFGALSDKVGRRPVYLGGALFLTLFAFPFFWMMESRQSGLIMLAVVIGLVGHAAMYGPQAAFFSELFGTRVRYSGASLGYQLASPLAGGLAPLIATKLLEKSSGKPWPVAVYLIVMGVITLVSVWLVEETNRKRLD
ncbi:MFS transporter [Brevifollis gellanilyticus]|uniref:MFS transporter n=1 Tax=Brevifollis gellanilyticus TaxID=748831 RepID=A0A512MD38_9BACT|nr:MFS transporter [Brevifollis gellanilyticus]GEP44622.1 MFS transporter [Brevifollis gellanilyticus]